MSNVYLRSLHGLFWREVRRFCKVPLQTIGTPIVNVILYLLIFGISLGSVINLPGYTSYLEFLIPGLITMTLIKNAYENSSSAIIISKYLNELQDLRTVALTPIQIAWAKSLASTLRGIIVGLLAYGVGVLFHFIDHSPPPIISHPFLLAYFMIIGGLAFSFLGIFIAMWGRSFEEVSGVGSFVLTPLIYLGGVFFPLTSLHPTWQYISRFNPILYIISGIRYSVIGISDINVLYAVVFAFATLIVFFILSLLTLRKGANYYK